ncbi:MAG: hypothetical protein PW843_29960 [Azospirillaceae bacterium]|nr:hypothetical protein [Azospirillaceae bacterium]
MAGIVFIFLIMLMALSMYNIDDSPKQDQTQDQKQQSEKLYQETLARIMEERARMIEGLQRDLAARHIDVAADAANGRLILPAGQFFPSGTAALSAEGRDRMAAAAEVLARYLTCKPDVAGLPSGACPVTAPVELVDTAVFAGAAPKAGTPPDTTARIQALEASAALISAQPTLYGLQGRGGQAVLSVHGAPAAVPVQAPPQGGRKAGRPAAQAAMPQEAGDHLTLTFTMALPPRS